MLIEALEEALEERNGDKALKTGYVRKIAANLHRRFSDVPKKALFKQCETLLKKDAFVQTIVAYDLVYRRKESFDASDFDLFETWVYDYTTDWGDVDDFGTHALGHALMMFPEKFDRLFAWARSKRFPVRRMAAVVLIPAIRKNRLEVFDPFQVADILMDDAHDLVQKGYGWMLKELSVQQPHRVEDYLRNNVTRMPRTAFRYALEKFPKETKDALMALAYKP